MRGSRCRSVAALAVSGALVVGCSSATPTFGASAPDRDAWSTTLSTLDSRFFNDAALNGWATHPEARCYVPVREDGRAQAALETAWCGPAYAFQSTDDVPWVLYTLRSEAPGTDGPVSIVIQGEPRIPTSPAPDLATFWRPDSRRLPSNPPSFGIARPAPPAAAPRATFFERSIPSVVFDERDVRLRGATTRVGDIVQEREVDVEVRVTGVARRTVAEVDGELRSAPDGHVFLTWRLDSPDTWTDLPETSIDVLIDGAVVLEVDPWGTPGERYLTAVVEESSAVTLRFRDWNGWEQTLDLISGERSDAPAILYSGRDRLYAANQTYEMPFQIIGRSGLREYVDGRGPFPFGAYPHVLTVQEFALTWVAEARFGRGSRPSRDVLFPTSTDRAFLTWVTFVSGGNAWLGTLEPEAFSLVLPDGSRQPAVFVGDWRRTVCSLVPNQIYFEVPADFTAGVIEVRPGRNVSRNGCSSGSLVLDYRDTLVSIDVRIP